MRTLGIEESPTRAQQRLINKEQKHYLRLMSNYRNSLGPLIQGLQADVNILELKTVEPYKMRDTYLLYKMPEVTVLGRKYYNKKTSTALG